MIFDTFAIPDVLAIRPRKIGDERGYFAEMFRDDLFQQHAGPVRFVQENQSLSARVGTLRGIHFQTDPHAQGKLVRCTAGAILDIAVDLRVGSPTFSQWVAVELTPDNCTQLWVPAGFGHAFCTLKPDSVVCYKVTDYYSPECDRGVRWDDPAIGIEWPACLDPAALSDKDRVQPLLADLPAHFQYKG